MRTSESGALWKGRVLEVFEGNQVTAFADSKQSRCDCRKMAEKESMCQDGNFLFGVRTIEIPSLVTHLMMNEDVGKTPGVSANHFIPNMK